MRVLPDDARWRTARWAPSYMHDREALAEGEAGADQSDRAVEERTWTCGRRLEARAKKLERALRAPRIRKPSQVYHLVTAAAPDEVLFLLYHSAVKPVQERLRNYFQKYLPAVAGDQPEEWATIEAKPGTPKYAKARDEFISEILNRKPKKVVEEEMPPPTAPPVPEPVMGRRGAR